MVKMLERGKGFILSAFNIFIFNLFNVLIFHQRLQFRQSAFSVKPSSSSDSYISSRNIKV